MQSLNMNPNWAEENLQTIRTLMERSALYRRALAPIMIFAGITGIVGGLLGWLGRIESTYGFLGLWFGAAIISLVGALLLVRRQALKDSEPFWSPPTRRVTQALMPAFFIGLMLAVLVLISSSRSSSGDYDAVISKFLLLIWTWLYGCAIHSAGFFMPRGVRWLGWVFIMVGLILLGCIFSKPSFLMGLSPHLLMAAIFGGLHLAYGIYLYFTEKKTPVA
jgi:hypothetical protein